MGTAIGDLVVNLLGNGAPLSSALKSSANEAASWSRQAGAAVDQVRAKVEGFGKGIAGGLAQGMAGPLASLTALGSAGGAAAFMEDLISKTKEITRESRELGVSVEFYQQLGVAAQKAGRDMGAVQGAIERMQNAIADGATKVNDASRTFQRLGLDPEKLMGRNAEEQFRAVARAIMQIGNDTLRTQAEMEVFGRGGKELEGVLRQVASGVADSYKVMTDAQVYAMNRLAGSGPSVMNQVGGFTADVVEKDTRAIATLMLMATQGIGWTKALRMVTEDQTHAMEAQAKAANDDAAATRRAQQEQAQYAAIKKAGEGRQAFQLQTDQMAHLREEGFAASGAIVSVAHEAQAMIDRLVESVGGKLTPAALEAIKGIKQAAQARAEELRQQKVAEAELARDTAGMNPIDRQHVQVAREYGNSVADRVAALARQTLGTDKAAELELKIKLVGLSEAQKQMAEFVHQGGAPAAADAIGRLAVKFDELSQVRDIGLRAHAAEVGDFQAKLDELAAGGWSREFVQKYRDAAEAIQAHELKMQFDPEERLREELRRIEQVRGKLDDATYGRARQKANDDYLRETHQEPGKLFGGAAVKGSEDAYKIIYDAMADQWQGQRQVDLLAAIDEKMGQLVAAKNDPTSQGMSEDTIPIPP